MLIISGFTTLPPVSLTSQKIDAKERDDMPQLTLPMQEKLRDVVSELVLGHYDDLEMRGILRPEATQRIKAKINRYPGKITMPPQEAFVNISWLYEMHYDTDIEEGRLSVEREKTWKLVFQLWFDNKESDLSLETTYIAPFVGEDSIVVELID
jgi:hypothetical protein